MPRRLLLALVVAAGCDDGPMAVEGPISVGPCDGLLTIAGSPLVHASNPPNSGPHYPIWAAWDRQYDSLQRGYYIHNAEHGGIVLLYNCDPDCPEVVASLVDVARNMAPDSTCIAPITKRVLIVKDPEMPAGVQVAAVAWNYTYTASCFDPYVTKFAKDHYRNAPEDFCNEGASFGGTPIAP
jgi:hypothetical protein